MAELTGGMLKIETPHSKAISTVLNQGLETQPDAFDTRIQKRTTKKTRVEGVELDPRQEDAAEKPGKEKPTLQE